MKNIKLLILFITYSLLGINLPSSANSLAKCDKETSLNNPQKIIISIHKRPISVERSNPSQNVYATLFTESNIIEIQSEYLEDVQISIVDDFGSIMMETNQNISHKSVIKLNDNLPSGKYYLIIESEYYHGEGVFYLN